MLSCQLHSCMASAWLQGELTLQLVLGRSEQVETLMLVVVT